MHTTPRTPGTAHTSRTPRTPHIPRTLHASQASHVSPADLHASPSHVTAFDDSASFECGTCPPVRRFDVSLSIGGDAGQGVESAGAIACRALMRAGYFAFGMADYRSRIRGGTNFYQVRASDAPVLCHGDPVHVIATLTRDAALTQLGNLARGGALICDESVDLGLDPRPDIGVLSVPIVSIAENAGSKASMNMAALGAAMGVIGFSIDALCAAIEQRFARKAESVVRANVQVAREAHEYVSGRLNEGFPFSLPPVPSASPSPSRILLSGNEAFCLGAAAGGCRFIAAYPMTPATTILEWMAAHAADLGIVAVHAEDEIAAACMAVGAGLTGARAMTSTSGGGLCLMTEACGMAGMTEVPLVIVDVQRGGPSTGLPTRTEQSDLLLAFHPSHGDFPHIVLAPGTVQQCFEAGYRAFNLADRYQCPVIVLLDSYVGGSLVTLGRSCLSWNAVERDRGEYLGGYETAPGTREISTANVDAIADTASTSTADTTGGGYLRYALTETGISPRVGFGHAGGVHAPSTDEHEEDAHITEESGVRVGMMRKRMRKMETALANHMRGPAMYGDAVVNGDVDVTLLVWGSTLPAACEAVALLAADGICANVMHYTDVWPVSDMEAPLTLRAMREPRQTVTMRVPQTATTPEPQIPMDDATGAGNVGAPGAGGMLVAVEQNYTGQMSLIHRMITGRAPDFAVLKYDGRQISPREIADGVREGLHRSRKEGAPDA